MAVAIIDVEKKRAREIRKKVLAVKEMVGGVLRPVVSTWWPRINARDPEVVLFLNAVHRSPVRILIKGIKARRDGP